MKRKIWLGTRAGVQHTDKVLGLLYAKAQYRTLTGLRSCQNNACAADLVHIRLLLPRTNSGAVYALHHAPPTWKTCGRKRVTIAAM